MISNLTGTTILHYRILRAIGSGGMGVVYEAEDTKLGRRVALKFLPPELAGDPAALERFAREARAASALNHPNICTIHAIEEADGARFIAMELLEGESLERRIASRPLAWDALVDTAVQVAGALDAAHRRGIIHRDIKPANIFLTTDGRAKVLDFGVAKMSPARASQAETMGASTAEPALTGAGMAVGTVAYMSPEQARGEELDARSDLFSLAAVLYEMSTGRRAFDGPTTAVVFSRILERDPDPPREINPTLPPKLEDMILRGLEKDRELRYQDAADLRAELQRLKRDATSGRLAFVPAPRATPGGALSSGVILATHARRHKGLAGIVALLVLALTAAAGYGVYSLVRRPPAPEAGAGQTATLTRLTTSGDVRGCGSISPDGKYVVFCDFAGRMKLRQVATGTTVDLGDAVGSTTFSHDSNFVYVASGDAAHPDGVLYAIPTLPGGERRRVLTNIDSPVGVSPDGQWLAFVRLDEARRESSLMVADTRGENERRVALGTADTGWFADLGVSWSHDGTRLSATRASGKDAVSLRPVVINVETGATETLGTETWPEMGRTAWLPGGTELLFTATERRNGPYQFWIVTYPEGKARRITSDARGFGNYSVSVTADGSTVATVPWDIVSNIWSTNADATAPLEQWTSGVRIDGDSGIGVTSDGRVFFSSSDGSQEGIWSIDAPGARPRRLTRDAAEAPALPHDGRYLMFQAMDEGRSRIWRSDPDGSGARPLNGGETDGIPLVSPDGRWVYHRTAGSPNRIMRTRADGGGSSVLAELPASPRALSPDGRHILANARDASLGASYVILDAETGAITSRVVLPVNELVVWGRTDELLAYVVEEAGVFNVWERPLAGGEPRRLTNFSSGRIMNIAYSPDRKRLFLSRGYRTGDVWLLRDFR